MYRFLNQMILKLGSVLLPLRSQLMLSALVDSSEACTIQGPVSDFNLFQVSIHII